jgi:hypothetical protein
MAPTALGSIWRPDPRITTPRWSVGAWEPRRVPLFVRNNETRVHCREAKVRNRIELKFDSNRRLRRFVHSYSRLNQRLNFGLGLHLRRFKLTSSKAATATFSLCLRRGQPNSPP